eukprot:3238916-Pyramimonas_sp.AAC.1
MYAPHGRKLYSNQTPRTTLSGSILSFSLVLDLLPARGPPNCNPVAIQLGPAPVPNLKSFPNGWQRAQKTM